MSDHDFTQYLKTLGSEKFQDLWPAQEHILDIYSTQFSETRDIGIELPTGAGKTLIALLIGGKLLESRKKVVILSANKTLSRQMSAEAKALKLQVAYMEGRGEDIPVTARRSYQRARAIGVMNYWVYFNQNPVVDPADVIVMDDAHLAEQCLDSLYSVMISRKHHYDLFKQLVLELHNNFPGYSILADAVLDYVAPTQSAELLSFIDQIEFQDRFKEIIAASSTLASDIDFSFRWNRLRNQIHTANLYISRDALWLRPYIYPLISNAQYQNAEQVLYMSATIGDSGDLARRLGTREIHKIDVQENFSDHSSGRRLIVMNATNDETDIPDRMALALLKALQTHPKSVWLCASEQEANRLREILDAWLNNNNFKNHPSWQLTPLGDEIDHFRKAHAGHLFVAGRFDGMDFSGDECRIVVLSTLPRAINLQEEFLSSYLRDSGFMRRRLNQRIVQALGRCNRNDDDFGVYFLADQRFATYFSRESNREGIPKHIMGEIDLAQDLAEIEKESLAEYVAQFLNCDFNKFDDDLDARLIELFPEEKNKTTINSDTSKDEVIGWAALFESENFEVAQQRFEQCWNLAKKDNLLEVTALHGWHRAKALYLEGRRGKQGAENQSFSVLEEAITRGGSSTWFNRMRGSLNRARDNVNTTDNINNHEYAEAIIYGFDEQLERLGTKGMKFQMFINNLETKLDSKSHAEYQEGLEHLGTLLGYRASRPKHGSRADCMWRGEFGNSREIFVFEAKIEHQPSNLITVTDIGQANTHHNRAIQEYEHRGYFVRTVIITHLDQIASDAQSSLGPIQLIHKDVLAALWSRIREILSSYRSNWSVDDVQARRAAAAKITPNLPKTGWLLHALDNAEPWLLESDIIKEWDKSH